MPNKFSISYRRRQLNDKKELERAQKGGVDEQNQTAQAKEFDPKQAEVMIQDQFQWPKGIPHHLNEIDRQHTFAEDDPVKPEEDFRRKRRERAHSRPASQSMYYTRDPILEQDELLSAEQVAAVLKESREDWDRLRECSLSFDSNEQWVRHFTYRRLDLLAPSNYSSIKQI
mmetsp:Transcript_20955/g.32482  ORF Transcript_20955/g.32482 Transcript_20955/m.32482 type:complete len:171 (-) Transcript_20955:305-817(-)|eukprot:CAMPEP_0170510658 /NCGR_PEP_ID=MMETSP0208-20121228/65888_1 /TAXON_ID=197538 /ORGANISM="Strombidium inclinatum, Strain S3" /LENGTH=170 /DNA_ID=CAMNT_0010794143 /DNA_START=544 /DNA_END=1056 /DNA_ORIENTATION=+